MEPTYLGRPVLPATHMKLQGGIHTHLQAILNTSDVPVPTDGTLLIITTNAVPALSGIDEVVDIFENDYEIKHEVRSFGSKAYCLLDKPLRTNRATVYLRMSAGRLGLVRGHFGYPYPPLPSSLEAPYWPGYEAPHLLIEAGPEGCRQFWTENAWATTDIQLFASIAPEVPPLPRCA